MSICNPATRGELAGAQGPFLLEVLLGKAQIPGGRWQLQQSVRSLEEGLAVASRMSQAYEYRLFMGRDHGYLYLDWQDDADGYCSPRWIAR